MSVKSVSRVCQACVRVYLLQSSLCRSSQPLAGLLGRSPEDEQMIQCVLKASPNAETLHVMDTRPRVIISLHTHSDVYGGLHVLYSSMLWPTGRQGRGTRQPVTTPTQTISSTTFRTSTS